VHASCAAAPGCFPVVHRIVTCSSGCLVQCLAEIAGLVEPKYDARFQQLYLGFMTQLVGIIRPDAPIPSLYAHGSDSDQMFIQRLALFFTSFFRVRLPVTRRGAFLFHVGRILYL
jgi:hypothetical protein